MALASTFLLEEAGRATGRAPITAAIAIYRRLHRHRVLPITVPAGQTAGATSPCQLMMAKAELQARSESLLW
eukprot:CAMPEP_0206543972 /NCGR_PEP_ID=MMETSP0325_2-20121206/11225_1 /ASSEMBLY_ACC=CAM_ASM_000347 /TAXON_ID=2866 /ORGANISM="Crypthecodinium cohnii, Strain Seligo" /LENGTH=71 /DNA_ID=CAMNT_0054042601 /DNA_START=202 /DNA_END=414 /DNA_ORIENTATION=-